VIKKSMQIVALVPMRHYSERVPGKNYRPLADQPLYSYILKSLLMCSEIATIVVDTDSPIIKEGIANTFPAVQVLNRPEHLRGDEVPINEVLLHDVEQVQAPFYLQTHSTNPLLSPDTISRAVEALLGVYPEHDALFSVTRVQTRMWDADCRPINHDPLVLLRTQDLPPIYEENSCIYLFERESFLASRNRLCKNPMMFEIDASEAWDIDDELNFSIVEMLIRHRARSRAKEGT
jgi:CMP-N-acetylneuraminic acid synthetase